MKSVLRLSLPILTLSALAWPSPLNADVLPEGGATSDANPSQTLVFKRDPKATREFHVTFSDSTIGKIDKPDAKIGFNWGHFRMTSNEHSSGNYHFVERTIRQDGDLFTTQVKLQASTIEAWRHTQGGIYREDGVADQSITGKPLHKRIEVQAGKMLYASNFDGADLRFSLISGRLTGTINGMPAPESTIKKARAILQNLGVPSGAFKPTSFHLRSSGEVVSSDESDLQGFDAISIQYLLQLPKEPIAVGASWESKRATRVKELVGEKDNAQAPALNVTLTNTLTELEVKDGRHYAIIHTEGVLPLSEFPAGLSDLTVQGRSRIDIDRGVLVSGDYEFKVEGSHEVTDGINDDLKGCTLNVAVVRHIVVREVPLSQSKRVKSVTSSRTAPSNAARRAPH